MKKNIFSDSSKIKSIFKDENIFDISYFPEEIYARDSQIKDIKHNLDPLIRKKKTQNLLICGPPGTGKTLVTKYVLNHLTGYTSNAKHTYINAIEHNTRYSVLHKISLIFDVFLPRRGLSITEVIERIKEGLSKSPFIPVVVVDEIDQIPSNDCSNLLYDLSRIVENNNYFCFILITNNKNFFLELDARTQSSLFLNNISFPRYSPKDLKDILSDRVNYGLLDDALSKDLLGYIAGFSAKRGGDARVGIDLLYKSAKLAEKQGSLTISKENVLEASKLIDVVKFSEKKKSLSDDHLLLLKKLEDSMLTSDLYNKNVFPERTVRRYLSIFEKLNIIRIEEINSGKGRSRKIFLNFEKDLL